MIPDAERKILARDADLVPLIQLIGDFTTLSQVVICYRLSELRVGSTAVFATWNWGFGALEQRNVNNARALLGRVEALQRQASSGGDG